MNTTENKQLMKDIFSELSKGNDKLLIAAMSENMQWNWMGTGQWSKSFKGKSTVLNELWAAVKTTLTQPFKVVADFIIAEGDYVVVQSSGHNTTPDGKIYNNKYCWVCRISEGKLQELNEYMDTELVTETFKS